MTLKGAILVVENVKKQPDLERVESVRLWMYYLI